MVLQRQALDGFARLGWAGLTLIASAQLARGHASKAATARYVKSLRQIAPTGSLVGAGEAPVRPNFVWLESVWPL